MNEIAVMSTKIKVKRIRKDVLKRNFYLFSNIAKLANVWRKNAYVSRTKEMCHVIKLWLNYDKPMMRR